MQSATDIKKAEGTRIGSGRCQLQVAVSACWGGLSIATVAPAAPAIDVIDPRRISKLTSLDGKLHMQSEGHRN